MANYLVPERFWPGKYPSDRSVHRRSGDGGRRFRADGQRTRPERPGGDAPGGVRERRLRHREHDRSRRGALRADPVPID